MYNASTYAYYDASINRYQDLGSDISGTEYDVAHVIWGGNWVMPTLDDFMELYDNCITKQMTLNGVSVRQFISKINRNSIYLPAGGNRVGATMNYVGSSGACWTSTQDPSDLSKAYYFQYLTSITNAERSASRTTGYPVRPVEKPKTSDVPAEAIDLGFPSGTKWAPYNVGATKPEEYGGYYAWGETEEKEIYNWSTYIHCDGSEETCHDLGSDISGTEYDVAHVKWGGNWVMPNLNDINELLYNCTIEWTTLNGVNGKKFTSNFNGNSIFLPATGQREDVYLHYAGSDGYCWSSSQYQEETNEACYLYYDSDNADWSDIARYLGRCVRPVIKN